MKAVKRLSSVVFAVVLVLAMTVTAFAANNDDAIKKHSYKAYQIFAGTVVENNGKKSLSNITWGDGIASTTFLSELKRDRDGLFLDGDTHIFAECSTADDVAKVLNNYEDNAKIVKAFAKVAKDYVTTYKTVTQDTTIDNGYYLFVDNTSINTPFVKAVTDGKVDINVKVEVPQAEKKVYEDSYEDTNYQSTTIGKADEATNEVSGFYYGEGYNDVADYSVGDTVTFRLYGTVAADFDDYKYYYYAFNDTLSKGLTYIDTVKVTLYKYDGSVYNPGKEIKNFFTVTTGANNTVKFECKNLKAINDQVGAGTVNKDSIIVVEYQAKLNKDAAIATDGNLNEVQLVYSNNPTYNQEGEPDDDNKGETPKDSVVVLTYELDVNKYDSTSGTSSPVALAGAEFVIQDKNSNKYYNSEKGWLTGQENAEKFVTNSNGELFVKGIEDGTYYLIETKAPNGYKIIDDKIEVTLTARILPDNKNDDCQNWTPDKEAIESFAVSVSAKDNAASIANTGSKESPKGVINVFNTKAYDLPGTGGMGTTLIYIAGSILVAGAVLMFIIRRVKR